MLIAVKVMLCVILDPNSNNCHVQSEVSNLSYQQLIMWQENMELDQLCQHLLPKKYVPN